MAQRWIALSLMTRQRRRQRATSMRWRKELTTSRLKINCVLRSRTYLTTLRSRMRSYTGEFYNSAVTASRNSSFGLSDTTRVDVSATGAYDNGIDFSYV